MDERSEGKVISLITARTHAYRPRVPAPEPQRDASLPTGPIIGAWIGAIEGTEIEWRKGVDHFYAVAVGPDADLPSLLHDLKTRQESGQLVFESCE